MARIAKDLAATQRVVAARVHLAVPGSSFGTPTNYPAAHTAFVHGWWTIAAVELTAAMACLGIVKRRSATS
ncbi:MULTISPECIES: hypothetical protein [unclassified Streptomyces]|uniref:hypothetical protein n=1 Tax=unclassified Streptomyces TaxID=2593676 RepID=UPI00403CCE82